MQFGLLVYHDETRRRTPEEKRAHGQSMQDVVRAASEAGVLVTVAQLDATANARTSRMGPGGAMHTDGPFAETKEQLGGLCVVDCATEAEAREWAERFLRTGCPSAMEVRPLAYVPGPAPARREGELAAV